MIRITGGKFRGRQIPSPKGRNTVRPTTAMMRESLFSRIQMELPGARFLDLFAGSGIISIEALSRGADFVLAVDQDQAQCRSISQACQVLDIEETTLKVIHSDSLKLIARPNRQTPFEIIFMDPPYGFCDWPFVITALSENNWATSNAILIAEHGATDETGLAGRGFSTRQYGDTAISFGSPEA